MTSARRQTVFASLDQPGVWPPTPRALQPQRLELALDSLPGVAATTQRKLGKLGLASVRDVLEHRPRRYETAAEEVAIAELREGEELVFTGRVLNVEKRPMRGRRRTRIVARVADDTATVSVTWFNQPWLADRLKPGTEIRLRGKLGRYGFEPRSYDIGDDARATADFAPVYPAAEEIAAATVRRVVDAALPLAVHVPDPLPA
jgi:ATP-dependent DNA helicase RecG